MASMSLSLSPLYRKAIYFSLVQQVPCVLLCSLLLDSGRTAKVCAITMIAYWAAVALIMISRPTTPASTDVAFMRWAFMPLLAVAILLAQFIRPI